MPQHLASIAILVRDYDEAKDWYIDRLGFDLIEDTPLSGGNRWVLVAPRGSPGTGLLLARAVNEAQAARIGDQTGGRIFLFLHTDDFQRDYAVYMARGVTFTEQPRTETYGTVAVFRDLYGNLWDLIERGP